MNLTLALEVQTRSQRQMSPTPGAASRALSHLLQCGQLDLPLHASLVSSRRRPDVKTICPVHPIGHPSSVSVDESSECDIPYPRAGGEGHVYADMMNFLWSPSHSPQLIRR